MSECLPVRLLVMRLVHAGSQQRSAQLAVWLSLVEYTPHGAPAQTLVLTTANNDGADLTHQNICAIMSSLHLGRAGLLAEVRSFISLTSVPEPEVEGDHLIPRLSAARLSHLRQCILCETQKTISVTKQLLGTRPAAVRFFIHTAQLTGRFGPMDAYSNSAPDRP